MFHNRPTSVHIRFTKCPTSGRKSSPQAPDRRALRKGQEVWQSGVEGHRINVAGCSAAEARLVWDQEVAGSNPATPTRLFDGAERDR